jgi:hypothetical protein
MNFFSTFKRAIKNLPILDQASNDNSDDEDRVKIFAHFDNHESEDPTKDLSLISEYEERLTKYIVRALEDESESEVHKTRKGKEKDQRKKGKHSFLTRARHTGEVLPAVFQDMCAFISTPQEKSDFCLVSLIRLLHFDNVDAELYHLPLERAMATFPFWAGDGRTDMGKLIFWSENHTFMFLTSAYLFQQWSAKKGLPASVNDRDVSLCLAYLDAHLHKKFDGVYEALSCTYLPWTLCALLNLYDFADDLTVKSRAHHLINRIVCAFTLVASCDGMCNLTASARQYQHVRLRNWGHNVNQLMQLVTGHSLDDYKPTTIGDFLATSSWRPPAKAMSNFLFAGSISRLRLNHRTRHTKMIYSSCRGVDPIDLTPFYW